MTRRIATISVAVVLALLGTLLVMAYVNRADARALDGVETVEVMVAKGALTKGQTVKSAQEAGLVGTEAFPRKSVPSGALAALDSADAALVFASDVSQGEILQRPRLVAPAAAAGTALDIPEGKLAVTVQLEDPARVASFVTVGSSIAVFDSYNVFEGNQGASWTPSGDHLTDAFPTNKATRVLLPKVQVLAVGGTVTAPAAGSKPAQPSSDPGALPDKTLTLVTVAVNQDEAEKLIHGTQTGTLYLGLLGTYEVKPGPGVDNRTLFTP